MIALAAVLWFIYLVPTWLKRREYLATERNAVRLQQTMRIMAESAELPAVVRVEATARTAAAQERAIRKQARLAGRRGTPFPEEASVGARMPAPEGSRSDRREGNSRAARRLRRSRALASLVLIASFVAGGFGVSALATSGSWLLLAASTVVAVGALALLGQASAVSRARAELRRAVVTPPLQAPLHDDADYTEERQPGWMPVPIPRPLYLRGPAPVAVETVVAKATAPQPDHAAALRAAAAEAEHALRAAHAAPEVTRIAPPSAPAAESRFARMGMVDTKDAAPADLDDILRRRRTLAG
ncbi:hypothetical protein GCM10022239_12730 [Leifsonia bigeumensis]|uniref:Large exoprotein n=1 Tax=Leifsonella bigeumensis TaxID=433643 RepID=A0ABP7FFH9_9MICO